MSNYKTNNQIHGAVVAMELRGSEIIIYTVAYLK